MLNVTPIEAHRERKASRRAYALEYKLSVVQETLAPGASVAVVARLHGINANVVFGWRRLYREGKLLGASGPGELEERPELLPVILTDRAARIEPDLPQDVPGSVCEIEIEVGRRRVRIRGVSAELAERILRDSLQ